MITSKPSQSIFTVFTRKSDLADPAVDVGPGDVFHLAAHQTVDPIVDPHLGVSQQSTSNGIVTTHRSVPGVQAVLCERPDKKQADSNFVCGQHCR